MKVALVCPTVGQTLRGYERMFTDLQEKLQPHFDVTLFRGPGDLNLNEVAVSHFLRQWWAGRRLPGKAKLACYHVEFATFALSLLPRLGRDRFDLVHVIDPPLATWLSLGQKLTGAKWKLVYTDAGPQSIDKSARVDHTQCINQLAWQKYTEKNANRSDVSLIPVGVDTQRFVMDKSRQALRQEWEIPEDKFVFLEVASINRHHKRLDYLIQEAAQVDGDFLLWIDGSLHPDGEPDLLDLAQKRLGERCRITHVDSEQLPELYALADRFVHAATNESYGMAIAEALVSGLPVLIHDSSHFRWLTSHQAQYIDMAKPGALTAAMQQALASQQQSNAHLSQEKARSMFDWQDLLPEYLAMYERVMKA